MKTPKPKMTLEEFSRRGGQARVASLTPEQLAESASVAGKARWAGLGKAQRSAAIAGAVAASLASRAKKKKLAAKEIR